MIGIKDKADGVRRIMSEPVFDILVNEFKEDQIKVFMSPSSNPEKREDAHKMVVAIEQFLSKFESALSAEKIERKRNN